MTFRRRLIIKRTVQRIAALVFLAAASMSGIFYIERTINGHPRGGTLAQDHLEAVVLLLILALLSLGIAGLWLYARLRGRGSHLAEVTVIVTILGFGLFSGPIFGRDLFFEDSALLGLGLLMVSLVVHGAIASAKHVLPLWATLPMMAAPVLMGRDATLGSALPIGPLQGPLQLLAFAAVWALVGAALLHDREAEPGLVSHRI